MRTEFALDPDAPGAGVQQALIERFVRDTRRGSAEQFVAAFVLMARSLGVDARIASGFVIPEDELGADGVTALRSDMAAVWPEVRVEGLGWVPFDPVPPDEAQRPGAAGPAAAAPDPRRPAAAGGPAGRAVERDARSPTSPRRTTAGGVWDDVLRWVGRARSPSAVVALPLAAVAGLILWLKRRRRRRLLEAPTPAGGRGGRGRWPPTCSSTPG